MKTQALVVPIAAIAIAFGSLSSATAQNAERRNRGARSQNQNQERPRDDDFARPRTERAPERDRTSARRNEERRDRAERSDRIERSDRTDRPERTERAERAERRSESQDRERPRAESYTRDAYRGSREVERSRGSETRRDNDRDRYSNRRGGYSGGYSSGYSSGYSRGYYAPRRIERRYAPRRYYGAGGGRLTLYFGIGSGYRYGTPYSGRVYGYRRSVPTYDNYVAYGDLRLKVSPRDAAVYVDGYYAGIVDDFDGFFERLTLEVGPHEIEIEAPGFGSQVFDVYVDPERTIDLHADLLR